MRKITQTIKEAFENKQSKTVGNTFTDGQAVYLHGNKIIERRGKHIFATLSGWNTPTTRERLNGILNAGFHQKNFEAFLNDKPVDENSWIKIS